MAIELRPLTARDASAHCAGEDELTVRWLTGGYGDVEGTVFFDPDNADGIEPDDVSLSHGVHPWARGQGVAPEAVRLVCELLRSEHTGTRAAIRAEPENAASVRVAENCGFTHVRDFDSTTDRRADGSPVRFTLYVLDL